MRVIYNDHTHNDHTDLVSSSSLKNTFFRLTTSKISKKNFVASTELTSVSTEPSVSCAQASWSALDFWYYSDQQYIKTNIELTD